VRIPDPAAVAKHITLETGLQFSGSVDTSNLHKPVLEIYPEGHPVSQTFKIRTAVLWRSIEVSFVPGAFASALIQQMGKADASSRAAFLSVIEASMKDRAEMKLLINGINKNLTDPDIWQDDWTTFLLELKRGQLDINQGDIAEDLEHILLWTGRMAAAVTALLPLESEGVSELDDVTGYPEGAKMTVEVNRYERNRRNRAAAIAIHGYRCAACEQLMADTYGEVGQFLIEVHHVTPVSQLVSGYIIDPAKDLIPLCPNCHAVTHTQTPPYSLVELRDLLSGRARPSSDET
jgi:5-methylcytosine-specific restriction enzyme A